MVAHVMRLHVLKLSNHEITTYYKNGLEFVHLIALPFSNAKFHLLPTGNLSWFLASFYLFASLISVLFSVSKHITRNVCKASLIKLKELFWGAEGAIYVYISLPFWPIGPILPLSGKPFGGSRSSHDGSICKYTDLYQWDLLAPVWWTFLSPRRTSSMHHSFKTLIMWPF